jgi:hypothetical protein
MNEELTCVTCGGTMTLDDSGVSFHLTDDGMVDYDQDGDHTPVDDSTYGIL